MDSSIESLYFQASGLRSSDWNSDPVSENPKSESTKSPDRNISDEGVPSLPLAPDDKAELPTRALPMTGSKRFAGWLADREGSSNFDPPIVKFFLSGSAHSIMQQKQQQVGY